MHTLKHARDPTFRFVIVKLDNEDLPLFARNALYEDFSDSLEGPRGYSLLRVMCGLVGQPLSPEAVKFATLIDQETREFLAEIAAARDIGDIDGLVSLTARANVAWWASPLLLCQAARALIDLGNPAAAFDVLEPTEERFPQSIRLQQLQAIALARLGQSYAAQRILGELYAKGHRDPETLGIYARTWFDRYKESRRLIHLEKSRDLYAEAFEYEPRDYYTGINAASKSVFLGDLDAAKDYAARVEELVGTAAIARDYWKTVTVGEVQLIQQHYDEAARLYREAVLMDLEAWGSHSSTLGQARVIMDQLGTPPEQREKIEQAFE
jgi:tetratricopeptide (TPR) repeat protein